MTSATRGVVGSVLVAFVAVVGACSSSNTSTPPRTTTSASSASSSLPATSTTAAVTTTTSPQTALVTAVWPTTAGGNRYSGPVAVARAFSLDYLHFVDPTVGPFREGDARSGEVPVRTTVEGTALGPVTTVIVRQIDGSWWVLGAATPNIRLVQPAPLATIRSPVRLRGTSTAFEGTVNVSIRRDNVAKPVVESFLAGGSNGQTGRFDASFTFAPASSGYGAIVLYTISSATGHVAEATVIRVRLSAT